MGGGGPSTRTRILRLTLQGGMVSVIPIDTARAKRGFASETLELLTESQVDILLEVMRGLLLCNEETEAANSLARAVEAVEAAKG